MEITESIPFSAKTQLDSSGPIEWGVIGVANQFGAYQNATKTDSARIRQQILTQTIGNCLGIGGVSLNQPESIFRPDNKLRTRLASIDKEMLKMLYDPAFPSTISRKNFESTFKDVLYHMGSKEKVIRYVQENNVPVSQLQFLRDHCFNDSVLYKFPQKTFIRLEGNYQETDYIFFQKAVHLINKSNKYFQLIIHQTGDLSPVGAIRLTYQNAGRYKSVELEMKQFYASLMHPSRLNGEIKMNLNAKIIKPHRSTEDMFKSIYAMIVLRQKNLDINKFDMAGIDADNNPYFKTDFNEILALMYNPVFPSGFTLQDMHAVIAAIQPVKKPL